VPDIPVPGDTFIDDPKLGEEDMAKVAGEVDATIDKVLDQAFSRAHEDWLNTRQLAASGDRDLAEVNRWSMQSAATNQLFLASGILAQRSAQAQPQVMPGPGGTGVPDGFKLVPV
jgi:hypothetical protein